jgi:hypothetical protein
MSDSHEKGQPVFILTGSAAIWYHLCLALFNQNPIHGMENHGKKENHPEATA